MRDDETDSDASTEDPRRPSPADNRSGEPSIPDGDETTRSADGAPAVQREHIGKYRVMERLGAGGMGEVFRAEQTDPRRPVAIKVIKRGMDTQEVIRRFEAERQALALMDHPNIAKVFDAGSTSDGRPYFVMEHVRGIPITTYADKHKLSVRARLRLFIRLCEGVQHAHQKAIIHRDLKPSNVLVTTLGSEPVPKIIDFGVAKATAQKLTEKTVYTALGVLIGTPEYMSPEQAELTSEDIDTRTDVYSLGVILYELLAGALPFEPTELRKAGFDGMVRMIREVDPPLPSTKVATVGELAGDIARARHTLPDRLRSRLRGDLDWITMRALDKDRTLRYGSAAELAADIDRHLKDEPVLAGQPSAGYRARKFVRRHRTSVAFAAVLVLLLAGFGVTMATQAGRIARERDRANVERDHANAEAARASQKAQAAQQVTDFLISLFDVSDPRVHRGEEMTASEILNLGAAKIEDGDVGQAPLHQARLLETMARVYQNQGLYDRTAELLQNAVNVRRREQGPKHPDVARTLARLGWLRGAYQREPIEARTYLLEAISIQEEAYGPDHVETAWSLYYLGSALSFGQVPGSHAYLQRARVIFEDSLGAESLPVAWCWNDLANSSWDAGDYQSSLRCIQRATEIKEHILSPDDPDLATSLQAVGQSLVKLGRWQEAEPYLVRALQISSDALGWNHDHTAFTLTNLARMYRRAQNYARAREYAERSLGIFRNTQGEGSEMLGWTLNEIALVALETGRNAEAESLFAKVVENVVNSRGPESPQMAEVLEERATSLRKLGRQKEVTALDDRVKAIRLRWMAQAQQSDAGN